MLRSDDLHRFHTGDESFFRNLHERFHQRLRADISRVVHRPDDIDDVLQSTWVRIFEQRTSFANRGSLEGWLRRICRNVCSDWLRAQQKRRALADRLMRAEESDDTGIELSDASEHDVGLQRLYELIENEIKALSDLQFEIAIYRWLLEYSTKQSAACAHVAVGTVKAALHQARQKIRAQLAVHCTEEELGWDGRLHLQHLRATLEQRPHRQRDHRNDGGDEPSSNSVR